MSLTAPPLFGVERLGVIMQALLDDPREIEGVLNPAGVVGPDGHYYLFPRLVAAGNYSRIGVARVLRDAHARPCGVERLGIALEPEAHYEIVRPGMGGCEDPRVTYLASAGVYLMAYTALGPLGPHVALASSRDLRSWTRHGLVDFAEEQGIDFSVYANKDAMVLPETVRDPHGRPALAMLHRPMYEMWTGFDGVHCVPAPLPDGITDDRPSMWLSYCPLSNLEWLSGAGVARFTDHYLLATPDSAWEAYRIGGGTVPLRTEQGWLTFYHGVELYPNGDRCYQAGALLLDHDDPRRILARSEEPVFGPETPEELVGVVGNVVFPTAIDERADGFDVYYGMADSRIGVAHLTAQEAAAEETAA